MKKLSAPHAGQCAAPAEDGGTHGVLTRSCVFVQVRASRGGSATVRVFCCEVCWHAGYRPVHARRTKEGAAEIGWMLPSAGEKVVPIRPGVIPRLRRLRMFAWASMPADVGTPAFPDGEAG